MRNLILAVIIVATSFMSANVNAADIAAGKTKAIICAGCHGLKGVSTNPLWPNLAGQQEAYLAKQIKAFKDGIRKDATMAPMVAALSDADIANLAAYYSSLK